MNFSKIDIIAQNFEKYMTFSFSYFRFLDSFKSVGGVGPIWNLHWTNEDFLRTLKNFKERLKTCIYNIFSSIWKVLSS